MRNARNIALVGLACLAAALAPPRDGHAAEAVAFAASDHVRLFADYYPAKTAADPTILLFHQAGSNRAEYATIGPRLAALGFNALAVDQRAGGTMWGRPNETVQQLGRSTGFGDALPDLEAALQWTKSSGHTGPIIVWGSSYSASLVFLLAAKYPQDIRAVLAFSPGEYLHEPSSVQRAAALLQMPIFVTSAKDPGEIAEARAILAAAKSPKKVQLVPQVAGVHGSSTLRPDRNPKGAAENWAAVEAFLKGLAL